MKKEEKKHAKDFLDELSQMKYKSTFKELCAARKRIMKIIAISLIGEF